MSPITDVTKSLPPIEKHRFYMGTSGHASNQTRSCHRANDVSNSAVTNSPMLVEILRKGHPNIFATQQGDQYQTSSSFCKGSTAQPSDIFSNLENKVTKFSKVYSPRSFSTGGHPTSPTNSSPTLAKILLLNSSQGVGIKSEEQLEPPICEGRPRTEGFMVAFSKPSFNGHCKPFNSNPSNGIQSEKLIPSLELVTKRDSFMEPIKFGASQNDRKYPPILESVNLSPAKDQSIVRSSESTSRLGSWNFGSGVDSLNISGDRSDGDLYQLFDAAISVDNNPLLFVDDIQELVEAGDVRADSDWLGLNSPRTTFGDDWFDFGDHYSGSADDWPDIMCPKTALTLDWLDGDNSQQDPTNRNSMAGSPFCSTEHHNWQLNRHCDERNRPPSDDHQSLNCSEVVKLLAARPPTTPPTPFQQEGSSPQASRNRCRKGRSLDKHLENENVSSSQQERPPSSVQFIDACSPPLPNSTANVVQEGPRSYDPLRHETRKFEKPRFEIESTLEKDASRDSTPSLLILMPINDDVDDDDIIIGSIREGVSGGVTKLEQSLLLLSEQDLIVFSDECEADYSNHTTMNSSHQTMDHNYCRTSAYSSELPTMTSQTCVAEGKGTSNIGARTFEPTIGSSTPSFSALTSAETSQTNSCCSGRSKTGSLERLLLNQNLTNEMREQAVKDREITMRNMSSSRISKGTLQLNQQQQARSKLLLARNKLVDNISGPALKRQYNSISDIPNVNSETVQVYDSDIISANSTNGAGIKCARKQQGFTVPESEDENLMEVFFSEEREDELNSDFVSSGTPNSHDQHSSFDPAPRFETNSKGKTMNDDHYRRTDGDNYEVDTKGSDGFRRFDWLNVEGSLSSEESDELDILPTFYDSLLGDVDLQLSIGLDIVDLNNCSPMVEQKNDRKFDDIGLQSDFRCQRQCQSSSSVTSLSSSSGSTGSAEWSSIIVSVTSLNGEVGGGKGRSDSEESLGSRSSQGENRMKCGVRGRNRNKKVGKAHRRAGKGRDGNRRNSDEERKRDDLQQSWTKKQTRDVQLHRSMFTAR